jgi:starvation-inducible outer membrane lipoprotein
MAPQQFAALIADPEAARGQEVRVVAEVQSLEFKEGRSFLTVSQQLPETRGRARRPVLGPTFLVVIPRFLSPRHYFPQRQVFITGTVAGKAGGFLLVEAREIELGAYPVWEKYYYPVPPEWYDYDPALEQWYTPPYFDPWRDGRR